MALSTFSLTVYSESTGSTEPPRGFALVKPLYRQRVLEGPRVVPRIRPVARGTLAGGSKRPCAAYRIQPHYYLRNWHWGRHGRWHVACAKVNPPAVKGSSKRILPVKPQLALNCEPGPRREAVEGQRPVDYVDRSCAASVAVGCRHPNTNPISAVAVGVG